MDHVWLACQIFQMEQMMFGIAQQVPFALERCLLPSIHFVVLASTVKVSRPFLFSTIHSTAIIATQNLCLALIVLTPQHPRYVRAACQSGWETIATRTPQHQSLSRPMTLWCRQVAEPRFTATSSRRQRGAARYVNVWQRLGRT